MEKDEITFINYGHPLHLDTKQEIIYKEQTFNCIKACIFLRKRFLKQSKHYSNFNGYWSLHRNEVIEEVYKEILKSNKNLLYALKDTNYCAYIDGARRYFGIGYLYYDNSKGYQWTGKNIIGNMLENFKKEM